ncbi:hypothetical protein [Aridibaculum aurantiacum]|uniref:hypothetical protein n=1 Tax=Aridibaculum aurantiacum TaxID=2810307 RepID=UPI001F612B13|nr:hypothetical protein [Aridibaculum aurantiacum]
MKFAKPILILLLVVVCTAVAQSQPLRYSNLRTRKVATASAQVLDSLSIVPNTFSVIGYDTSYYQLDFVKATLTWKKEINADSVEVRYRVFPYKLNAVAKRFTYDSVMNNFISQPFVFNRNGRQPATNTLFDFGQMNYNGSFGRALSFGNNQDVVVNSQFNLQLSGLIGDSIQVAAAITDNNIPIQPDGTTQQLNEFDRVWLQFKKRGWEINMGDIDLRQDQNYFLRFFKRLQGLSYAQKTQLGPNISNKTLVSGAIAKGKFTRNILQVQEGNQGPYRLQGANNEFFFIVLAGTERVYLDGVLLQRGEDQDYVINYNTAEIAFTPRRMITKDVRIQVEFEYADRNYLNSFLYGTNEMVINKNFRLNIAAYSNADAKNSPINQQLDTQQKQFLNDIGDNVQRAYFPNAVLDTFAVGKILYAKRDTISNGNAYTIFIYSTDKDSAKFNLSFTDVGFNRGNYIPDFNGANGKVFKWVAPVNGVPQGNFEPATLLVTPKKQQMLTVGAVYDLDTRTQITAEAAVSNYDINSFSTIDKGNDKGIAGKFMAARSFQLKNTATKALDLKTSAGYEFVDHRFRPLERLRTVEFYRDWGLPFVPDQAFEHLSFASMEIADRANNRLQYQATSYTRNKTYKGFRHTLQHDHLLHGWQLKNAFNLTTINSSRNDGFFLRPSVDISKTFNRLKNINIGGSYVLEHNELKENANGVMTPLSFAFTTVSAYIKSNQAKDNRWTFTYFTRSDKLPSGSKLEQVDRSHNYSLLSELLANEKHQVRLNVTYRQLQVINNSLTNLRPENSLLGRLQYSINEWRGFVTGDALYEIGSGQEQRRDFSFIEVPASRGEFAWNDYNGDGIRQLNEFEVALFPDQAKFIRVFTPTNDFIKANYTQFNYSLSLNPKAITAGLSQKKLADFIGRFNLQSTFQVNLKEISSGDVLFNPFKGNVEDTSLITVNNIIVNTLSFNRFSTRWGIDVSNNINFNRALLTYGLETRRLEEWGLRGRWTIARQYTIELIQKVGANTLATPKFANRNFAIANYSVEPRFTYTKGTSYRIQSSYLHRQKRNEIQYGGERSISNALNLEGKYNAVNNTSLTGKFTYNHIEYSGQLNSTISYIMLDALLPGKNLLWNLDLTRRLGNNLEVSIQYEGRKPGETRTIHIGRASLRAIL